MTAQLQYIKLKQKIDIDETSYATRSFIAMRQVYNACLQKGFTKGEADRLRMNIVDQHMVNPFSLSNDDLSPAAILDVEALEKTIEKLKGMKYEEVFNTYA